MRRLSVIVVAGLLLGGGPAFTQGPVPAPEAIAKATTPEIPFDSVPNFLTMPPGVYMGEGVGVATNSKGHVFVYTRSGETRLFEFDRNGAFVKEFLHVELERSGEHGPRGDLQGPPEWPDRRQVREGGQDAEGIRHGQQHRLPDGKRSLGRGDLELACTKSHGASVTGHPL